MGMLTVFFMVACFGFILGYALGAMTAISVDMKQQVRGVWQTPQPQPPKPLDQRVRESEGRQ